MFVTFCIGNKKLMTLDTEVIPAQKDRVVLPVDSMYHRKEFIVDKVMHHYRKVKTCGAEMELVVVSTTVYLVDCV